MVNELSIGELGEDPPEAKLHIGNLGGVVIWGLDIAQGATDIKNRSVWDLLTFEKHIHATSTKFAPNMRVCVRERS